MVTCTVHHDHSSRSRADLTGDVPEPDSSIGHTGR